MLVLAGCAGTLPGDSSATPSSTADAPSVATRAAGGETETGGSTVARSASPWPDPVVVAVDPGPDDREYASFVRAATDLWEADAEEYAGYAVAYEVRPDAADADVVVRFVHDVPDCGGHDDAVGCAPVVTDAAQVDSPVSVYVATGLSDESTVRVLEHEFGHTLGLRHDDEPRDVMRASTALSTTPQPDATDRPFPWNDGAFAVHVDAGDADDPDAFRSQVGHALDYYAAGAPGMPANLTFSHVDDADDADLVVRAGDCGQRAASCANTRGPDPDGDGAIERYTHLTVTVDGLDADAVGWHVGYWLAYGFGAEADAEKPPPFRDASYAERRSEWWE